MRHWRKGISRVALMGLMAFMVLFSAFLPGTLQRATAAADVADLSLYQRASELTREFATALAPGSETKTLWMLEKSNGDGLLVAGNAGGLLGYAELLEDDKGVVGWLMNAYTGASATITYDQLMHVIDVGAGESAHKAARANPFYQYAGYGEVLTEMGLVSTIRTGGMASMGRVIASGLMLVVYMLASAAPFLFRGALLLLVTLNPFKLFETVIHGTANADLGMLSSAAEYVGELYKAVQDLSIYVLFPMLLVITVLGVLMFSKGQALKRFSRYGVRVFMLFAGLPLIGATYTGLIEDLDTTVAVGSEYADYLVLSSYVDFENWVKYSRLAPPEDAVIKNPRLQEDESRSLSDRKLILAINGKRAHNERAAWLEGRYSATSDIGEIFETGGGRKEVTDGSKMDDGEKASFSKVFSLLTRHMSGARYTSSDYDGEVSGQIQLMRQKNKSEENEEAIVKMFSLTASDTRTWSEKLNPFDKSNSSDKYKAWMKAIHWNGEDNKEDTSAKGLFTEGRAKNEEFQFKGYPMNIYNTGNLQYDAFKGYNSPLMPETVKTKTKPIGSDSANRSETIGGLSPIAMYNFLNTTFSNTGLTVYSPNKTASDLSRDAYASVTFGGSGVAAFTRWGENFVVMLSLALLSISYGVMMITVAVKSIPRILSGVFGTALGSIAFATKLMISTAVLLIQVLGMIFMYALSENIIMSLLLNFNNVVNVGGDYFGAGVIFQFLSSLLVAVITATVAIFMVKNVNVFKEMMEEFVSNSINRVMGALDVNTGGKGLDTSRTTDGRMGSDGRLTDDARKDDAKGLAGALGGAAGGGILGGAASMLSAAHGVEAKREQIEQELGKKPKSFGDKVAARIATAKDLAGARTKDSAKGILGVEGQSYQREMDAKDRKINSLLYGNHEDTDEAKDGQDGANNPFADSPTSLAGQVVDDDGAVLINADGDAVTTSGDLVSAATPLAMSGRKAMVGDDDSLLDMDGNTYTDEMGNAFYQNDKGQLVDENGAYVALDKDGVLQPVAAIPGHNGKPVNATKEAKKLNEMRYNPEKYKDMKNAQNATHHGMDADGNVIGKDGKPLEFRNGVGETPKGVKLDSAGFVTDKSGKRIAANSVVGNIDERGFERVADPETGQTHLRHKGDEAMKHVTPPNASEAQSMTALSRQATRASEVADKANARVKAMKSSNASPYAVAQAERFASVATRNAQTAQQNFNQAMASDSNKFVSGSKQSQAVTDEHVASAIHYSTSQQQAFQQESGKLEQMRSQNAPQRAIERQEQRVEQQRRATAQASQAESTMRMANKVGRSYGEVHNAHQRVNRAEQLYSKAQSAHAQAVATNQPPEVIARQEAKMNKAANHVSNAQMNMKRVSTPPMGSRSQIDKATARYETAQAVHQKASRQVRSLQNSGANSTEIRNAQVAEQNARRRMVKAQNQRQHLMNPTNWDGQTATQTRKTPTTTANQSYATLARLGASNYGEYSKQVQEKSTQLAGQQSKLRQAEQRLATLRTTKRPAQDIETAERQVKGLRETTQAAQTSLNALKDNAHGLLKNGSFQPIVASRPLRTDGSVLLNQMVNLNHSQSMYDKLSHQEKAGTLTDAGRRQMEQLGSRINVMRKDLVSSGIREDSIRDTASINQASNHLQQSWDAFINGKTVEREN